MSDKIRANAKMVYEGNKIYISENIDKLHHHELYLYAKKQDQLYLISIGEKLPGDFKAAT